MTKLVRALMGIPIIAALSLSFLGQTALAAEPAAPAQAEATPAPGSASLAEVNNQVFAKTSSDAEEQPAKDGLTLPEGGVVRTGANSSVRLDFNDGTIVRIKEVSTFTITTASEPGNPIVELATTIGKLWVMLGGQQANVSTPAGVASVRGSMMGVSYNPAYGEIKVTCLETKQTCTVVIGGVTYELPQGMMLSAPPYDKPRIEPIDCGEQREWLAYNPEALPYIDSKCTEKLPDQDGDTIPDKFDNCPAKFNSDQADSNDDGTGNVCTPGIKIDEPTPSDCVQEPPIGFFNNVIGCDEEAPQNEGGGGGDEGPSAFGPRRILIW